MLRATGVAIGLPLLDAMLPLGLGAEAKAAKLVPRRMVLISRPLGAHASFLFPEKAGLDYESTRYLKMLDDHRGRFTLFSGLSHPGHAHHHSEPGLFTGVAGEFIRNPNDLRNTVSLDILAAEQVGRETRFPNIGIGDAHSYNRKGVRVPSFDGFRAGSGAMFRQLFVDGSPDEIAREVQRLRDGQSILDGVRQQARDLARNLGAGDRERLDTLLTSIREAEQRLAQDEAWVNKPKPKVQYQTRGFLDNELIERSGQWYDLAHLALQTDSTRIINLNLVSHIQPKIEGVNMAHHEASHHGQDEAKIEQLAKIEEAEYRVFNEFLTKMRGSSEGNESLLDRTMVFHGSNLGNASAHTSQNLPIIVAGGGFKHAGHVLYDRQKNRPLSNLYVRMLHQMGIKADQFGTSTGVVSDIG
ncbi:MAG: hypothetical protein RL514_2684 [Verrucomicrobiota bacterium]|jgi:hypothetical protein